MSSFLQLAGGAGYVLRPDGASRILLAASAAGTLPRFDPAGQGAATYDAANPAAAAYDTAGLTAVTFDTEGVG